MSSFFRAKSMIRSIVIVLIIFFFSAQLIIWPDPVYADEEEDEGCWNDASLTQANGGGTPPLPPIGPDGEAQLEAGEPVNLATGAFTYEQEDLYIPGRGLAFNFTRTYNSKDDYDGPLGWGWTHSYNISLIVTSNGQDVFALLRSGKDHLDKFKRKPYGTHESPRGVYDILTEVGDGYIITKKHGTKYAFDSRGRLTAIRDRNNNTVSSF